jgi:peptide/nickel transport system permease protein
LAQASVAGSSQELATVRAEEVRVGSRVLRTLSHHPLAWAGMGGFAFIVLFSFVGPLVYRVNPLAIHMAVTLHGPMPGFPLGTDNLGRDELASLMAGGRASIVVGLAAALSSMVVGAIVGLVAAWFGGWLDTILMRLIDLVRSIPSLFLLIFLSSLFQPTAALLVVLIAFLSWSAIARLVRAEVLSLRERTFVEASVASGASQARVMFRHLLPNAMGTVIVATTFLVADAILLVAALSFLGLGLPPPAPNWGAELANSMNYLAQNDWWMVYPPGVAILLTVISINFLGDAMREAFDSRLGAQAR